IGVHQYLTAAHCIENTFPGGQIAITNAASGDLGPPFYTVTFSFVHPSYALYKAVASLSSENAYDVGVFTINTSLPYPSRPLPGRSEEHTSELQSREKLVCRLLLAKKQRKQLPNWYDLPKAPKQ